MEDYDYDNLEMYEDEYAVLDFFGDYDFFGLSSMDWDD